MNCTIWNGNSEPFGVKLNGVRNNESGDVNENINISLLISDNFFRLGLTFNLSVFFENLGFKVNLIDGIKFGQRSDFVFVYLSPFFDVNITDVIPPESTVFVIVDNVNFLLSDFYLHSVGNELIISRNNFKCISDKLHPYIFEAQKRNERLITSSPTNITKRESQVIGYILKGLDNKKISILLKISEKTVSAHKINALCKIGVRTNFELSQWVKGLSDFKKNKN